MSFQPHPIPSAPGMADIHGASFCLRAFAQAASSSVLSPYITLTIQVLDQPPLSGGPGPARPHRLTVSH